MESLEINKMNGIIELMEEIDIRIRIRGCLKYEIRIHIHGCLKTDIRIRECLKSDIHHITRPWPVPKFGGNRSIGSKNHRSR